MPQHAYDYAIHSTSDLNPNDTARAQAMARIALDACRAGDYDEAQKIARVIVTLEQTGSLASLAGSSLASSSVVWALFAKAIEKTNR